MMVSWLRLGATSRCKISENKSLSSGYRGTRRVQSTRYVNSDLALFVYRIAVTISLLNKQKARLKEKNRRLSLVQAL